MKSDRVRLMHLVDAAEKASAFVVDKTKRDLDSDDQLNFAVVRALEIMGEAAAKLSDRFKETHAEIEWYLMVATRNRLIHGYFDVDTDIIWAILTEDLPSLLPKLRKLLNRLNEK